MDLETLIELINKDIEKAVIWPTYRIADKFEEYHRTLSSDELELLKKYKLKRSQNEFLGARYLLKKLYCDFKDYEASYIDNLNIERHESRAPILFDNNKQVNDLSYSIAHRKDYLFVALDSKYRVGIDVEEVHPKILKLKSKLLSPEEENYLDKLSLKDNLELYTRIWTSKECIVKIVNQNLFKVLSESKVTEVKDERILLSFPWKDKLMRFISKSYIYDNYAFAYICYG